MAPDALEPDDPDARRLAELEERLQKARGRRPVQTDEAAPPSKLGLAFRLVTELVAAVIVGGGIGWALDRVLGTSPFLLIVMFFCGIAAGIVNVVRTARRMEQDQGRD
jgi:ATP synthase protein I